MEEWRPEEDEEEYVPLAIPSEFITLNWDEHKVSVRELWQRYLARELILEPDFQRHYVWDSSRASRYIESLLTGLPTPPIFLAEEADGSWAVIDGHQRLETLFRYLQPLLAGPTSAVGLSKTPYSSLPPLRLRSLEVLADLNGRDVTALSREDRRKLWCRNLTVIRLAKDAHPDMKYILFARLNLGSMSLNAQELRNCLHRGSYNRLIKQLSESQEFLTLWGRSQPDKRMRHMELLLRFFALLHRRDKYRRPFRVFLNDEMEANRSVTSDMLGGYRREFEVAVSWVKRVFDKEVSRLYRRGTDKDPVGRWGPRRLDLIYELEMVGFAQFIGSLDQIWRSASQPMQQLLVGALRHELVGVMADDHFQALLSEGTKDPMPVHQRFRFWNGTLERVTRDWQEAVKQYALVLQRLRESTLCARCPYPLTVDDAVWDPSETTQPRLIHRFCFAAAL